ncbi:hypothetical protein IV203_024239 [Nitzschia inconspicua]|uniref:Uncharacterized protein n=1 Tax=Nitzschia inconspicua TaxID=303405 RepID=A0A9K3KCJ5_9STRA|nr:hypothetical protein IV203_024239 [Nitzschia inconspicua]
MHNTNITSAAEKGSAPSILMNKKMACLKNDIFSSYFNSPDRTFHNSFVSDLWHVVDNDSKSIVDYHNLPPHKYILIIGDSLDRIMLEHACATANGVTQKVEPDQPLSRPNVCRTDTWTAGYLNIFGMHRQCQPDTIRTVDPQQFTNVTTAGRIQAILPRVLDLMDLTSKELNVFVQVGSNLWDLSSGCNNRIGISTEYREEYRQGMGEVYGAIHRTIDEFVMNDATTPPPNIHIIWKLAPPVSLKYSRAMEKTVSGRIRANQKQLNEILQDTASNDRNQLDHDMVDWWDIVMTHKKSEQFLNKELNQDGRHYSECPSLVFFNALLEKIHDIWGGA